MRRKYLIDKKYLESSINEINIKDRLIVLDPKNFREEYRKPKNLICRVFDGAGCRWESYGTAILVESIYDSEKFRDDRLNVISVIKKDFENEVIEKYCR